MRIFEIFDSIQGEGPDTGYPTTFIRLAGCSLGCKWCDTERARSKSSGTEMTVDEVIKSISGKCDYICITGGEPLEQSDEVIELAKRLDDIDYFVSIETNGAHAVPDLGIDSLIVIVADLKTPSSGAESSLYVLAALGMEDEIKAVVKTQEDFDYAINKFRILKEEGCLASFVLSIEDGKFVPQIIECGELDLKVAIQLHKVLNVQ